MPRRPAAISAYLASASHLLAGLAMATWMRPGLGAPGAEIDARIAYLAAHEWIWTGGWLIWHLAGLTMVAFYGALALRWFRRGPIRVVLACITSAAALAADMGGQSIYLQLSDFPPELFEALDLAATGLTAFVANGFYTVSGVLLVSVGFRELPRSLFLLSLVVWTAGCGMSVAACAQSAEGLLVANAVLVPTLVLWTAAMGRWLENADEGYDFSNP